MRFLSTRGGGAPQTLSNALALGLAEDGGLFVPETFPTLPTLPQAGLSLAETASALIAPFFAGDALESELPAICAEALDFPVPVLPTNVSLRCAMGSGLGRTAASCSSTA